MCGIALVVVLGVSLLFYYRSNFLCTTECGQSPLKNLPTLSVLSFESCLQAGYPIMESYPRQCKTPDGRTYAEEIKAPEPTYVNASSGMIIVETPTPLSVTGKEFSVIGKARGTWFFEASFPVEVLDKDGKTLATGIAQAQSDWMTTELVGYKANISIPTSYIGKATLILKKDNPSGMPEHEASISFPITIEY